LTFPKSFGCTKYNFFSILKNPNQTGYNQIKGETSLFH